MALWDHLVAFDYTIWLLCAALYLLDHVKLVEPNRLLCEERSRIWQFRLHITPFTLGGKDLYLLDPLRPWWGAFVLPWGDSPATDEGAAPQSERRALRIARRDLLLFRRQATVLRTVSTISAVTLFVLGPLLTAQRGLTMAILVVVPIHVILVGVSGFALWALRGSLQLSMATVLGLVTEALICPPYAASLLKRVSIRSSFQVDGVELARHLQPRSNFKELIARAMARWDASGYEDHDVTEEAGARAYRARLRSWT